MDIGKALVKDGLLIVDRKGGRRLAKLLSAYQVYQLSYLTHKLTISKFRPPFSSGGNGKRKEKSSRYLGVW